MKCIAREKKTSRKMSSTFEIVKKLGEGSFGCVYKAVHKPTNQIVALKQLSIHMQHLDETIDEVAMLQQCNSTSIVTYYGSYIIDNDLWIVMEYCEGGSVSAAMKTLARCLNEREIRAILHDVLNALNYLHEQKTIHRDIKAANVLLKANGRAKLADLGVCCQLHGTAKLTNSFAGSPYWMAPEIVAENAYDCSADIWSLEIAILEMAEGKPPHAEMHPLKVLFLIPRRPPPFFQKPNAWSRDFVNILRLCLIKNAQERATTQELIERLNETNSAEIISGLVNEIFAKRNKSKRTIDFRRAFCSEQLQFLKDLSFEELKELLDELEGAMAREICELKERYEAKVTPIREAIVKKTTKT